MEEHKDHIAEAFREALQHHEVAVRPELWAGVQSALPGAVSSASAVASSGLALKAASVAITAGLITIGSIGEVQLHQQESQISHVEQVGAAAVAKTSTPVENSAHEQASHEAIKVTSEADFRTASEDMVVTSDDVAPSENADNVLTTQASNEIGETAENAAEELSIETETVPANEEPAHVESTTSGQAQENTPEAVANNAEPTNEESNTEESTDDFDYDPLIDLQEEELAAVTFSHSANQAISPNGDGLNDFLIIEGKDIETFTIQISDRNGNIVFASTNQNVKWNGVDRTGRPLPQGPYYFKILATGPDGIPCKGQNCRGLVQIYRD